MLATAEVTKMAGSITAQLPILAGISTAAEHQQALALMEQLLEQYDDNLIIIEALSNAITRYEKGSLRFEVFSSRQDDLDPAVATLRVLMEQHNLNTTDFENEIGKKSMVSQVLAGKKKLTREHIANLASRFDVSPVLFF
ncbi:HTH-type transcriptional regulator / antitoxin HigA [Rheinheimera pacifica]|uniref:HTH-type transcriptional regulator / antitoxin HigA n=1 Tax=Rheinheimera pacifica TaxID=173990 RepID=A0A1H6NFB9_9GAMM|nr:transcriptional regulator [Rheinheimera pacifica]SEI13972.1 HTH-type transcriptional regulator / antitoxin HigA [Rheinheimera pacifica]